MFAVLAAIALAGIGALAYATFSQLQTALAWTDHSIQLRGQIRRLWITLTDMETGQRGYIITGETRYLESYRDGLKRVDGDVATIEKLTAEDPGQQQTLARLHDLVAAKRTELQQTIDLRRNEGFQAARALVATDTGKRLMDEIKSVLQGMEDDVGRRLADRRERETNSLASTVLLAVIMGAFFATLLGSIYYLLRRQLAMHGVYEDALATANADLGNRVRERTRLLEESQARLNGIVSGAPDAIISIDETQTIVLANPAAGDMFGYAAEEMRGLGLERFVPERYRAGHHAHVQRFGESAVVTRRMSALRVVHGVRANGDEFPVDASISQVEIAGKKLYTVILRDITDEMRAKNEIERSRRELRELTAALEHVQEEERKRIAQELHDDLGQQLTVLKMDASLLRGKLGPEQRDALKIAERLESVLTKTVQSVRRISADLRPAMLDDLGLVPALEELIHQIGQRSGLECSLDAAEDIEVSDKLATPLFRVVQESLNNVVKHAQARTVKVSLSRESTDLLLRIDDDGKGIATDERHKRKSFGLIGMRERVYALGGDFDVRDGVPRGTTVAVRVPESG